MREQQAGDDPHVVDRRALADVEEVRPVDSLALLAAPRELVEADRRDRPKQPNAGDDREEEGHQRPVGRHHCRRDADEGVDQSREDQIAAHVAEIFEALAQATRVGPRG